MVTTTRYELDGEQALLSTSTLGMLTLTWETTRHDDSTGGAS